MATSLSLLDSWGRGAGGNFATGRSLCANHRLKPVVNYCNSRPREMTTHTEELPTRIRLPWTPRLLHDLLVRWRSPVPSQPRERRFSSSPGAWSGGRTGLHAFCYHKWHKPRMPFRVLGLDLIGVPESVTSWPRVRQSFLSRKGRDAHSDRSDPHRAAAAEWHRAPAPSGTRIARGADAIRSFDPGHRHDVQGVCWGAIRSPSRRRSRAADSASGRVASPVGRRGRSSAASSMRRPSAVGRSGLGRDGSVAPMSSARLLSPP